MLQSGEWQEHGEAWARFLESLGSARFDLPAGLLTAPLQKAHETHRQAQHTGERSDWHRYRIAVKNVRYLAAFLQMTGSGQRGIDEVIERCKAVQDQLGAWHDCSVQLRILRSKEARQLLDAQRAMSEELAKMISERRQQLMTRIVTLPPV
jgi:CHAD domain-containing protein